jgi:hypothetical protein
MRYQLFHRIRDTTLWSIAVLMCVFEEVDGIRRMQAFGLAFGVGLVFWVLTFVLLAPRP